MNNMQKNILVWGVVLLASCEYGYFYSYEMTNEAHFVISVELSTIKGDFNYIIDKNETKIVLETEHGIESRNGPHFRDVSYALKKCIVSRNDTVSKKIYLDNSSWEFVKMNNGKGIYRTTIKDDEFK